MDLNHHIIPDQIPDESYIERLFPKCPPKQQMFYGAAKRVNKSKSVQRRQMRSKVQQHSRRELEARRGKGKQLASEDNYNERSSESSENEYISASTATAATTTKLGAKRGSNLAGARYGTSVTNNSSGCQNRIGGSSLGKRVSKYTASQSLLQQLQRSQSSHNSNIPNNGNNSKLVNNGEQSDHPTAQNRLKFSSSPLDKQQQQQEASKRPSGIIKSASSFAFVDDDQSSSAKYQHTSLSTRQRRGSYQDDLVTRLPNENVAVDMNDNSQSSDLFEYITNSEVGKSIPSSNRTSKSKYNNNSKANSTVNFNEDINARSFSINDKPTIESYKSEFTTNKRNYSDDINDNCAKSLEVTDLEPTAAISSSSRTAVLENRDKTNSNNKSKELKNTTDDLISIVDQSPTPNNGKGIESEEVLIGKSPPNSLKSNETRIDKNRDDDKYINLFVYDNNTQLLQRAQISTSAPSSAESSQTQGFHFNNSTRSNGNNRYRPRQGKRYRASGLNKVEDNDNGDQNFVEQASNDIEITELLEKNEANQSNLFSKDISLSPTQTTDGGNRSIKFRVQQDFSEETNGTPTIISIHHQASQQLLETDLNDNDDDGRVVRNDASVEELCSDNLDEKPIGRQSIEVKSNSNEQTDNIIIKRSILGNSSDTNTNSYTTNNKSHKSSPTILNNLQTVDEKAEIDIDETKTTEEILDSVDKDQLLEKLYSGTMPASQPNLTRRAFVPPGYPQRIQPPSSSPDAVSLNQFDSGSNNRNSVLANKEVRLTEKLSETPPAGNSSSILSEVLGTRGTNKVESHLRVKFNEENLVSIRDLPDERLNLANNEKTGGTDEPPIAITTQRRNETLHLPIISEAQTETDLDLSSSKMSKANELESSRELSAGLNKLSLADHSQPVISEDRSGIIQPTRAENDTSGQQETLFQATREKISHPTFDPSREESQMLHYTADLKGTDKTVPNLRHQKLPNETSHYSIVRSGTLNNNSGDDINSTSSAQQLPRFSSIQFNTLSDNESGPEEATDASRRFRNSTSFNNISTSKQSKCDSSLYGSGIVRSSANNLISTSSKINSEDEMSSTAKTALVFPRLDEGLSSEAESCDEEIEEEDERAVEADVDADDDEEEDDDDVDDDNDTLNNLDRSGQAASADGFLRPQSSQTKTQNRLIGSSLHHQQQQHGPSLISVSLDQHELHQVNGGPGSAYGGYINQDHPDQHNELKPLTNYPNQNGQSNYWMGVSSHHQQNMSSQPSTSQQHYSQRDHANNNGATNNTINNNTNSSSMSTKGNNSFNRDDAKVTSRLSSDTDNETDRLLGSQRANDQLKLNNNSSSNANNDFNSNNNTLDIQPASNVSKQSNTSSREVLIEGVLFNVKYLGSTHTDCEGRGEKEERIQLAEMAVHDVKYRNGESQTPVEVQLFISTEKIMVLDDKHRKIMMDHSLKTISYIADIGDAIVLIVRKKGNSGDGTELGGRSISKISCHVFESSESRTITKSISQAFQVAFAELMKANGTGDSGNYLPRELDYQEVLNSQEMSTEELENFARKENQREVIVSKEEGEILGLSIVESGWGSVLPTVVITNFKRGGPADRCLKISVGDQILSVNGISLVGLPLAECQEILRRTRYQRAVRLLIVPCRFTVEVKIKRPDTKYQLGFSVQNGVICSLLRGGIAERGGVRVGHRIISINDTRVVGEPHEKIVSLLASSVGVIRMETILMAIFKQLLGEERPILL